MSRAIEEFPDLVSKVSSSERASSKPPGGAFWNPVTAALARDPEPTESREKNAIDLLAAKM
jgi:hypothetical protein